MLNASYVKKCFQYTRLNAPYVKKCFQYTRLNAPYVKKCFQYTRLNAPYVKKCFQYTRYKRNKISLSVANEFKPMRSHKKPHNCDDTPSRVIKVSKILVISYLNA